VSDPVVVLPEVAQALEEGRGVVALESTIISHGLPRPRNLEVAAQIEEAIRGEGAVPATIAVIEGRVHVGLDARLLERVALADDAVKLSLRDLPVAIAKGLTGATTVASTAFLAARSGIAVFATGGLGGVHREAGRTFDESADLHALADTPIAVVCSGVKSILDVPATLERLESLSVAVVGYRTTRFPGFYVADSGCEIAWSVDDPAGVARILTARRQLGMRSALVVANPLPPDLQLDPREHDRILQAALDDAAAQGISGSDVTPFLLARFHEATGGRSVEVNVHIILRNAALAAEIAVAVALAVAAARTGP
jgi:pseudouridine-5'-phosphate glycosidase